MNKKYYDILEVHNDADKVEIKKSYKRLAKRYHPDINKNKESEEKFKQINEAYEYILKRNKNKECRNVKKEAYIYDNFEYLKNKKNNTEFELDLFEHIKINIEESINGTEIKYKHKNGMRIIKIPPQIGNDEIIKISRYGLRKGNQIGDMYIKINIVSNKENKILGHNILINYKICPLDILLNKNITIMNKKIKMNRLYIFKKKKIIIENKGLYFDNSKKRGNLYIKLKIDWKQFFNNILNKIYRK